METGAGAYKIAGGMNGGALLSCFGLGASSAATLYLVGVLAPVWIHPAGLLLGIAIVTIITVWLYNLKICANTGCFWQGVGTGAFVVDAILEEAGILGLLSMLGGVIGMGPDFDPITQCTNL